MTQQRTPEERLAALEQLTTGLERRAFTAAERARILRAAELVLAAQDDIQWLKAERRRAR